MMNESRETAEWTRSHWAGTLGQLAAASRLASDKVQAQVPYPKDYDPDGPDYDSDQAAAYRDAAGAREVAIVVGEEDGYSSHLDSLDELTKRPQQTLKRIISISISVGRGYTAPSVTIRAGENGLSVEVIGYDRTWTAGLRHELERALQPTQRLRSPLARDPWLYVVAFVGFYAVWIGLDQIFLAAGGWSRAARLLVSIAAALLFVAAVAAIGWASAKRFEVLPEGDLSRYERWRTRVLAATGGVAIAVVGSALYALLFGT
jgi:hypothetical protein